MTEVPEHLLKKAAEARARLSGESGGEPAEPAPATDTASNAVTPASASPVPAVAATPVVPAEPEPDSPWVEAAKARKKIPVWVMPVLLFLPIWAIYYVGYLERPPEVGGLAVEGAEVYATCAGCHGAGGGGGSGRQLSDGNVTLTFPTGDGTGYDGLAGQLAWVANGSAATAQIEGSPNYGDPDREGGAHVIGAELGNMAGFGGSLSLEELVAVVFHERSQFGALDAEQIAAELALLDQFLLVREEAGDVDLSGETVAGVHESLDEARGQLGGAAG